MNCIIGETVHGDYLELGREVISQGQQSGCRFVWQWSLAEDYDVGARIAYNIV